MSIMDPKPLTLAAGNATYVPSVAPSGTPTNGQLALDQRLSNAVPGNAPSARTALFTGQEPSVVRWGGKYRMFYGLPQQGIQYRECDENLDPTVAANWSGPTGPVLSGWAHHSFMMDGNNLYIYGVDVANEKIGVATATTANWTTWTKQSAYALDSPIGNASTPASGNTYVVKIDATHWVMFAEGNWTGVINGSTLGMWQTYVGTGASPLGPFTLGANPLTSIRPMGVGMAGGPTIIRDNGEWVMLFHGTGVAGVTIPTNVYRAVQRGANLTDDQWEVLDGGRPFLLRTHEAEVDQAADSCAVQGPTGTWYEFHSGNQNPSVTGSGAFNIMVTKLYTGMMRNRGGKWEPETPHGGQVSRAVYPHTKIQNLPLLDPTGTACGGSWGLMPAPAASGGMVRTNMALSGDFIAFQQRLMAGTYRLHALMEHGPDMGIVTVSIIPGTLKDTFLKQATWDLYAATQSFDNSHDYTFTIGPDFDGPVWIRFKATSKNAASTNYRIADQGWQLTRLDLVDPTFSPAAAQGFILDSFNRADSTTNLGPVWTASNAWAIAGNKLTRNGLGDSVAATLLTANSLPSGDMRVSAKLTKGTSNSFGLIARAVDNSNYFAARFNSSGQLMILSMVAGTSNPLATVTPTFNDGSTLMFQVKGNVYTAYIDGVQVLTFTGTVSALDAGRKAGFRGDSVGTTLATYDDFSAAALY